MSSREQDVKSNNEHRRMWDSLLPVAASMAIALSTNASSNVENASASQPAHESRTPVANIKRTIKRLDKAKIGDHIKVMAGKTSNLIAKRGSHGYVIDKKSGELKKLVI